MLACVIRNVVMVRLHEDADRTEVASIQAGLRAMDLPGTMSYTLGDDLGLREGNWSFAIVADFTDAAAYHAYDADAGHNALRARLGPVSEQISRVQFELPDR
jgi:Stress responsive A/B Barrel Domain